MKRARSSFACTGEVCNINADLRNVLMHSSHGKGHDHQPILEGANIWGIDSTAWKFVPFWDGLWVERIIIIIYVQSYMHKCIVCLTVPCKEGR